MYVYVYNEHIYKMMSIPVEINSIGFLITKNYDTIFVVFVIKYSISSE